MRHYLFFSLIFLLSFLLCCPNLFSQVSNTSNSQPIGDDFLNDTGDVLQMALPAAAGITTIIKKDWEGTKQFSYSYATGFLVTHALKRIINKERPYNPHALNAFPSGHTSSAFSGASFIHRRYGWKYGKYAYLLASVVGISRVEGRVAYHDYWDVLAGAAIGIGSTYLFTRPYNKEKAKLSFKSNGKDFLFSFNYRF